MNTRAEIALDDFVAKYDAFLDACEECERSGRWDVRKRGPMSVYFETDLTAVVLQIMSADGVFESAEAEVFNRMFSTDYTPRQLNDMYATLHDVIVDYCDKDSKDALRILSKWGEDLTDAYRSLILNACEVVAMCDGIAEGEERKLIHRLRNALDAQ